MLLFTKNVRQRKTAADPKRNAQRLSRSYCVDIKLFQTNSSRFRVDKCGDSLICITCEVCEQLSSWYSYFLLQEYLESQGIEISKEEELPIDKYSEREYWKKKPVPHRTSTKLDTLRRFLEYDGKVLG